MYKQVNGLGIGLRASAAIARLIMCRWDYLWKNSMESFNVVLLMLYRYVDDIRTCLRQINKGWFGGPEGWFYDPTVEDTRSYSQRTVEEIRKSMDCIWDFLRFTTESQVDFPDGHLPTLDFATRVRESGYISYKFFSKPMSSNILLTVGTALSRGCIFSSLQSC